VTDCFLAPYKCSYSLTYLQYEYRALAFLLSALTCFNHRRQRKLVQLQYRYCNKA